MFQALDLQPTRVVSTAFTTFTYLLTTFVSGRTVTKTDIVVSTQVVTDRIEPTPVLKPVEVRKFDVAFSLSASRKIACWRRRSNNFESCTCCCCCCYYYCCCCCYCCCYCCCCFYSYSYRSCYPTVF